MQNAFENAIENREGLIKRLAQNSAGSAVANAGECKPSLEILGPEMALYCIAAPHDATAAPWTKN